jgi:hypothetical protein
MSFANPLPCAITRSLLPMLAICALSACDSRMRGTAAVTDEALAGRVNGVWEMTLRIERPMSLSTEATSLPRNVTGVVALVPIRKFRVSFEAMTDPTFSGVYDLDPGALGLATGDGAHVPGLVARVATRAPRASGNAAPDSIHVLLNPETPQHAIRLAGIVSDGAVTGVWVAESPLGGGGTIVWRRRAAREPSGP